MKIKSPLTKSRNTKLVGVLSTGFIIENYKKQLNTDVRHFFHGIKKIQIYKCLDTGYQFYYPFNTIGDSKFYEDLEKFPWYYMDWKWEHEIASTIINSKDKILEIGCGRGGFLKKIQQKKTDCIGLELNENAVSYGQDKKVKILNESIQNHSKNNHERYDVVCSFQVVEHIAKIKEFLQASIDTLKPGGKLIISVPNNCNYSIVLKDNILNMPPHHMGLWDAVSLANLQNIFPIRLKLLEIEPIQKYHFGYYQSLIDNCSINDFNIIDKFYKKRCKSIIGKSVQCLSKYLIGHTILAQYIKQ